MTKRCDYLKMSTVDCIRCTAKRDECPKKRNKNVIGQACWQVKV